MIVLGLAISSTALADSSKRSYLPRTCDQYSPSMLHQKASQYRHVIHSASHKYGVNANLIKAVITAETCFRPTARSHKGAAGLMQLMPATARRWGVTNRYNIAQNIHGGTLYLRWLLDRYNGSVRHAVAAYNSGEGTVDKYGLQVPYQETQRYLQQVMKAYIKMNGGTAPEFMRSGGVLRSGFKQSVRDSSQQFAALQLQAALEQQGNQQVALQQAVMVEPSAAQPERSSSRSSRSASRKEKRLLPSCMAASKKLHRATYHSDKSGVRTFFYEVQDGDSLDKIMRSTGKSTTTIKRYNNLRKNLIKPGQKLKVAECQL
ncbi:MAG: transglycosylase SLT domain-containing protein [Thiolinea sp.]